MSDIVALPTQPFNGQVFIDAYLVKWVYDSSSNLWSKIGSVNTVPLASSTSPGLLSASDKSLLDSIPEAGGGFGFIINNYYDKIVGDVQLVSDSLDITATYDGRTLDGAGCLIPDSTQSTSKKPGFEVKINDTFLSRLCIEVPGGRGPRGERGLKGQDGIPGYNDGPIGPKGDQGDPATVVHTFSGIKIKDVDTLTDRGVVAIDFSGSEGKLTYVTSKLNVPTNDTPAKQVIANPIYRSLQYADGSNVLEWELIAPTNDPIGTVDVYLLRLPISFNIGEPTEYQNVLLSDFVRLISQHYMDILCTWEQDWEEQAKKFIEDKDETARSILAGLSQQVAECEFALPLSYCLGFAPSDCIDPKVVQTALVEARHFDGSRVGPVGFRAKVGDTDIVTNWRTWPAPDIDKDDMWDINFIDPTA